MSDISEIGEQVVAELAAMFEAEETLRSIPDGIEWGQPGARQRLWWDEPAAGEDSAPDLVRVRILTELGEVEPNVEQWPETLWRDFLGLAEDNLWGGPLLAEEMDGRLCLGAAVSAHEGNAGYLPRVLFRAMAAQAAQREEVFSQAAVEARGDVLVSAPAGAMGELAESFHVALGAWENEGDSEFLDALEADYTYLMDQFQEFPCLMCNGDDNGLSAEFPFGKDSSLMRIDLTCEHPNFGPAIRISLMLPLDADCSSRMLALILDLNRKEQSNHGLPWAFGSWYLDEQMSPRIGYRLWLPDAYLQRNLLINLGISMVARARHCCEKIGGMSFEEAYPLTEEAMMKRLQSVLDMLGGDDEEEVER